MKKLIALVIALFAANADFARADCNTQATENRLSGAAKTSFLKKCVKEGCEAGATEKKLAGAAKASFGKKCLADGLLPYCEEQAANKKLAGAAKTSFLRKCQSGK
jgi:hypothetical protein